jgi:hypothetical protein
MHIKSIVGTKQHCYNFLKNIIPWVGFEPGPPVPEAPGRQGVFMIVIWVIKNNSWDRCYDFLNIFAEKISKNIGLFCSI